MRKEEKCQPSHCFVSFVDNWTVQIALTKNTWQILFTAIDIICINLCVLWKKMDKDRFYVRYGFKSFVL